jgi:phosphoribosylformylglycinamidine cyclo-ligase
MLKAPSVDQVNYDVLDAAKHRFIQAARSTATFASSFGVVFDEKLGASANIFSLDLNQFRKLETEKLHLTILPEGLGTADDARPHDMTSQEARVFWRNIATKVISCMTNDAASAGLQPLLIGLYLPSSTPEIVFNNDFLDGFLEGIVSGCREVGCVYLSGETPQLKTKMIEGKLDLAGAVVAVVPPGQQPVTGADLGTGDYIVLLESSGPHENGFTPLRRLAESLPGGYRTKLSSGEELWQAMNRGSKLYSPLIQDILRQGIRLTNIEHITGHGWQKLMRSSKPLRYRIEALLPIPEIFTFVQDALGVDALQMLEIFNYGAGMALFTRTLVEAEQVVHIASNRGMRALLAGRVEAASRREVVVEPLGVTLSSDQFTLQKG